MSTSLAKSGQAYKSDAGASGLTKLVMIHGTGAGHEKIAGEQWWQHGSDYQVELAKRLDLDPARIEIVPFQWEINSKGLNSMGPNSEEGRRKGGAALYKLLRGYDKDGHDYYLVGHSHGGSVIYNALLESAKMQPLQRLKTWCTVGTPFLDYRANPRLHGRLNNIGLTIYVTGVGALLFSALMLLGYFFSSSKLWTMINTTLGAQAFYGFYMPLLIMLIGYGVCSLGFLYAIVRLRASWITLEQKQFVAKRYGDRWLGFWHKDDEAISALANVKSVEGEIIPGNFLVPLVAGFPLLVTALAVLWAAWYMMMPHVEAPKWLADFVTSLKRDDAQSTVTLGAAMGGWSWKNVAGLGKIFGIMILAMAAVMAIFIATTSALVAIAKILAGWIGIPLAKVLNSLVWSSVRARAWGDDLTKEGVHAIGAYPPEFSKMFDPLPSEIAKQLSENSEKHAIVTLKRVREMLGMTEKPKTTADMRAELNETLKWHELIHTTYFALPDFINLTAFGLHRAGLADLKPDFWQGSNRQVAETALSKIMKSAKA